MIDHLSASQLSMLGKCPMQWYYRYVEGLRRPPGAALTIGKAVDHAATENLGQKIVTGEDLPLEQVETITAESFEAMRGETEWAPGEDPGKIKDATVAMSRVHYEQVQVITTPVAVQRKIELVLEGAPKVIGFVDVIRTDPEHDGLVIVDNKTSGKRYAENQAQRDRQLLIYDQALRQEGEDIRGREFSVVVKNKTPVIQTVPAPGAPTAAQVRRLCATIGQAARMIESGIFPPVTGGWWCSPSWCGYWDRCPYHV